MFWTPSKAGAALYDGEVAVSRPHHSYGIPSHGRAQGGPFRSDAYSHPEMISELGAMFDPGLIPIDADWLSEFLLDSDLTPNDHGYLHPDSDVPTTVWRDNPQPFHSYAAATTGRSPPPATFEDSIAHIRKLGIKEEATTDQIITILRRYYTKASGAMPTSNQANSFFFPPMATSDQAGHCSSALIEGSFPNVSRAVSDRDHQYYCAPSVLNSYQAVNEDAMLQGSSFHPDRISGYHGVPSPVANQSTLDSSLSFPPQNSPSKTGIQMAGRPIGNPDQVRTSDRNPPRAPLIRIPRPENIGQAQRLMNLSKPAGEESTQAFTAYPVESQDKSGTSIYSKNKTFMLEDVKSEIEQLYINQGKTTIAIVDILVKQYGISVSERTLKRRFSEWGFRKYLPRNKE